MGHKIIRSGHTLYPNRTENILKGHKLIHIVTKFIRNTHVCIRTRHVCIPKLHKSIPKRHKTIRKMYRFIPNGAKSIRTCHCSVCCDRRSPNGAKSIRRWHCNVCHAMLYDQDAFKSTLCETQSTSTASPSWGFVSFFEFFLFFLSHFFCFFFSSFACWRFSFFDFALAASFFSCMYVSCC